MFGFERSDLDYLQNYRKELKESAVFYVGSGRGCGVQHRLSCTNGADPPSGGRQRSLLSPRSAAHASRESKAGAFHRHILFSVVKAQSKQTNKQTSFKIIFYE